MSAQGKQSWAPREVILAALAALSDEQMLRLESYAAWRVNGLGRGSGGNTAEDLMAAALEAILRGCESPTAGRHWCPENVCFYVFFKGVIRSISSNWRRDYKDDALLLEESDDNTENLDRFISHIPNPEDELAGNETIEQIEQQLARADDELGFNIFGLLKDGVSEPEILSTLHISHEEYSETLARIQEAATKVLESTRRIKG